MACLKTHACLLQPGCEPDLRTILQKNLTMTTASPATAHEHVPACYSKQAEPAIPAGWQCVCSYLYKQAALQRALPPICLPASLACLNITYLAATFPGWMVCV